MVRPLQNMDALRARAAGLTVVLTDCDGVMTDGSIYYGSSGEMMRRFSAIDGMGIELLHSANLRTGVLSGEGSDIIRRRAEKLKMEFILLGIRDKREEIQKLSEVHGIPLSTMAYIGDDINDFSLIRDLFEEGITACPSRASQRLLPYCHYRTYARGGQGALREFIEWLLMLRGEPISEYPRNTSFIHAGEFEE